MKSSRSILVLLIILIQIVPIYADLDKRSDTGITALHLALGNYDYT